MGRRTYQIHVDVRGDGRCLAHARRDHLPVFLRAVLVRDRQIMVMSQEWRGLISLVQIVLKSFQQLSPIGENLGS